MRGDNPWERSPGRLLAGSKRANEVVSVAAEIVLCRPGQSRCLDENRALRFGICRIIYESECGERTPSLCLQPDHAVDVPSYLPISKALLIADWGILKPRSTHLPRAVRMLRGRRCSVLHVQSLSMPRRVESPERLGEAFLRAFRVADQSTS